MAVRTKVTVNWFPAAFTFALRKDADRRIEKSAKEYLKDVKSRAPVKTGRLKRSLKAVKIKLMQWRVGTDLDYAKFIEFGTSKMAPRPFMRSSFRSFLGRLKRNFR